MPKENTLELRVCFWNVADCWDVPSTRHSNKYVQDAKLGLVLEYCTSADARAGEGSEANFPDTNSRREKADADEREQGYTWLLQAVHDDS